MKHRILLAASAGAALVALALGGQAIAHHAFAAEFDGNAPVLLKGKVTKVEWINPHAWVHMEVVEPGKPAQEWMVEGGTPNTLLRTGINKQSLPVGTEVVVRGYQSKDALCEISAKTHVKTCKANGRDVTFPNGCKLFVGSSGTGAPRDGADASEGGSENKCAAGVTK